MSSTTSPRKLTGMRYSDAEFMTIKMAFAENDELIIAIRKVFLQMALTPAEETIVKNMLVGKKEVFDVIVKSFMPTLDGDAPLHQVVDLWMNVALAEKTPESALPHIESRQLFIEYISQQIELIAHIGTESNKQPEILLSRMIQPKGKDARIAYVELLTRNTIVNHVEQMLQMVVIMAGTKVETVEQTKSRLAKNSAK